MRKASVLVLCLYIVLPAAIASAEEIVLDLDPAQTEIHFALADVLHTVHGAFSLKRPGERVSTSTEAPSERMRFAFTRLSNNQQPKNPVPPVRKIR